MKDRFIITWVRQLPNFEIVGHSIWSITSPSKDPVCMYFKGTLLKQPKL